MTAAPLLELVRDPYIAPTGDRLGGPAYVVHGSSRSWQVPARTPLAVLVAPAGFGKTRLLDEWAAKRSATVRLGDAADRATTIRRRCCGRWRWRSTARCADAPGGRIVLVLDDVHVLRRQASRDAIAAIVDQLPAGIAVALASRASRRCHWRGCAPRAS